MNLKSFNIKLIIGIVYLGLISIVLYFLFSFVDFKDLTSLKFIKSNREIILGYRDENYIFLVFLFCIVSIVWTLLLGFATPLLLFSGFVFGKWWGILLALIPTTIGATLLYMLANLFFKDIIERYLAPKFSKLRDLFNKNDIIYLACFRLVGGGGTPFGIQNVLPTLFNIPVKNYFIATFIGCAPSMFISVSLGSGIENIINKEEEFTILNIITSPEIYLPISAFFLLLIIAFIIKKIYLKTI